MIFRPKSEIQAFFPPKIRWSPKNKKKKVFTEIESDFPAEIGNSKVFSAQNQVVSKKKKKRSSPQLRVIFRPISQIQSFEGGCFRTGGGAIFHFSQKIGLKSTKNIRFCILHKPMGGLEPPRPPLATLLVTSRDHTNSINPLFRPNWCWGESNTVYLIPRLYFILPNPK